MVFLLMSNFLTAQHKYEIGFEGGIALDKYKIIDGAENLKNVPCVSGLGGITVRINHMEKVFFEISLLKKEYTEGLKLEQESGYSTTSADEAILMAFRLGYPFKISNHFTIAPIIGIVPGYKSLNQLGFSSSEYEANTVWPTGYNYWTRASKDVFALVQGGLVFEFKCFKLLKISFATNYYQGLSNMAIYDIEYKTNNSPIQTALMYGKGSFMNYNFGIRYLLNKQ